MPLQMAAPTLRAAGAIVGCSMVNWTSSMAPRSVTGRRSCDVYQVLTVTNCLPCGAISTTTRRRWVVRTWMVC